MPRGERELIETVEDMELDSLGPVAGALYDAIVRCFRDTGRPPTLQELVEQSHSTISSVMHHIKKLVASDLIRVEKFKHRGIRIVSPNGLVCPCCNGSGIVPKLDDRLRRPKVRMTIITPIPAEIPDFVKPDEMLQGVKLKSSELDLLANILAEYPEEGAARIARRFQEKTGRLLAVNTVLTHRRRMVDKGVINIPRTAPIRMRGVALTREEEGELLALIRRNPSDGDMKIAKAFRSLTGRPLAKATVTKYRNKSERNLDDCN